MSFSSSPIIVSLNCVRQLAYPYGTRVMDCNIELVYFTEVQLLLEPFLDSLRSPLSLWEVLGDLKLGRGYLYVQPLFHGVQF